MPLLLTKLFIPPARPDFVERPHLLRALDEAADRRLTLIAAPAGFGKTTLLSQWCTGRPGVAWLSLDEGDGDPVRFCHYLIAAVQQVRPGFGESAMAQLGTHEPLTGLEAALTGILNEWAALREAVTLVLDDYHLVTAEGVHRAVAFLLERLPPGARLIIAGQSEPPLPLARLRARGDMAELRPGELRFSPAETRTFLERRADLTLTAEEAGLLESRTEGWAAGLQLAALALRTQGSVTDLLTEADGSQRLIFDYLAQEVFERQPAAVQTFLLQTAILERLSGPLCDALTGAAGTGQSMLERLELSGLFLIPLDGQRRWYRYHHLFAAFLRGWLGQRQAESLAPLHQRAAAWFEANGYTAEAVAHWSEGGAPERAADAVAGAARRLMMRSEVATLLAWLRALPQPLVASRADLCLHMAWALTMTGDQVAAAPYLEAADRLLPPEARTERAELANLRTAGALIRRQLQEALAQSRLATQLVDPQDWYLRSTIALYRGVAAWYAGDIGDAIRGYQEAAAVARTAGHTYLVISAMCTEGRLRVIQGRLHEAAAIFRRALELATDEQGQMLPAAGMALVGLGGVSLEWNDLEAARQYLQDGVERCRRLGHVGLFAQGSLVLSRALLALGDQPGALAVANEAEESFRRIEMALAVQVIPFWRADVLLAGGDTLGAAALLESCPLPEAVGNLTEFAHLYYAHVAIGLGRHGEVLPLLEQMVASAEAGGRAGSQVRILVLLALAYQGTGDGGRSAAALRRALALAEPEGFVRPFLDEGAPMARLLSAIPTDYARSVRRLLVAGEKTEGPDRLSQREVEVLRLLAEGLSNQEIAHRLVLTEGTAKWHVHNIYAKLGVRNRTEAVGRARTRGLLD